MRVKSQKIIITFHTTTAAMAMEVSCEKADMPGRLIPVPREITAGCGMAWSADISAKEKLQSFVSENGIQVAGWHELLL